jgi:hypothetical protein
LNGVNLNWTDFPKPFLGCPQALILKALATCLYPVEPVDKLDRLGNVIHLGVPAKDIEKIQKLVVLWNRSGPKVAAGRSGQKRPRESKDDDDGQDKEKDEKDHEEDPHIGDNSGRRRSRRYTKQRRPRGASRGSPVTNANEAPHTTNQFLHDEKARHPNNGTVDPTIELPVSPPSSARIRDEERFVWGPEKTAADIMSIAQGWSRAWELYEKRKGPDSGTASRPR